MQLTKKINYKIFLRDFSAISSSDKRDLILTILYASFSFASFSGTIFLVMAKKHLVSPFVLSFVLLSQKFVKILFDIPFGLISDKFGTKKLFMLTPFLSIMYCLFLKIGTLSSVIIAVLLHGTSIALRVGKIETRIYNTLQRNDSIHIFKHILSLYFICTDLLCGVANLLAGFLYDNYEYDTLLLFIVYKSIFMFCLIFFLNKDDAKSVPGSGLSIKEIAKESISFMKKNLVLSNVFIVLGFLHFMSWQFPRIAQFAHLEMHIDIGAISKLHGLSKVLMGLGSVVSFFIIGNLSIKFSFYGILIQSFFCVLLSFFNIKLHVFNNTFSFIAIAEICFSMFYSFVELPLLQFIEMNISSIGRATISSVANIISVTLNIVIHFFLAYLAVLFGVYNIPIGIFMFISSLFGLWSVLFLWPRVKKSKLIL